MVNLNNHYNYIPRDHVNITFITERKIITFEYSLLLMQFVLYIQFTYLKRCIVIPHWNMIRQMVQLMKEVRLGTGIFADAILFCTLLDGELVVAPL